MQLPFPLNALSEYGLWHWHWLVSSGTSYFCFYCSSFFCFCSSFFCFCSSFLFIAISLLNQFFYWTSFFIELVFLLLQKTKKTERSLYYIITCLYKEALLYPVFRGKKILCFAEKLLWHPVFRGKTVKTCYLSRKKSKINFVLSIYRNVLSADKFVQSDIL